MKFGAVGLISSLVMFGGGYHPDSEAECKGTLEVEVVAAKGGDDAVVYIKNLQVEDISIHMDDLPFSGLRSATSYSFTPYGALSAVYGDISVPGHTGPGNNVVIQGGGFYSYRVNFDTLIPGIESMPKGVFAWRWELAPYCAQDGELLVN